MLKKKDRILCAYISLLFENIDENVQFELKDILFTYDEIVNRANMIPKYEQSKIGQQEDTRADINANDINRSTVGYGGDEKYLIKENDDSLLEYYRLIGPDEIENNHYNLEGVIESIAPVLERAIRKYTEQVYRIKDIIFILEKYSEFIKTIPKLRQGENQEIVVREAIWIATATLTYNEYIRSGSVNMDNYLFSQTTIANLAQLYNTRNTLENYRTGSGRSCVQGKNTQMYSYLIEVGDKRRVSFLGEDRLTYPEDILHEKFMVNTIDGQRSVKDIKDFIENVYSSNINFIEESIVNNEEQVDNSEDAVIQKNIDLNRMYTKEDFLSEVFLNEDEYNNIVGLLKNKKNIILQGPPGVGKTFLAKKLAYSIMQEKNDERVGFVQFHQNYSYEDFIMGFRPKEEGFELKEGIFYEFCKKVEQDIDSENDYFFIIDEINRGNVSKIFGELLMLIEKDYRDTSIRLSYTNEEFSVPSNVYIIGLMNTADRSLAMIDYALRRRFGFYEMKPAYDNDSFKNYQNSFNSLKFNKLIECVKELNKAISSDDTLGTGFCIGHSYFCNHLICTDSWLYSIVNYEIIPLINEYWFDNREMFNLWASKLREAIND